MDTQRRRIAALAEARGWIIHDVYVDNDVSASKPRGPKSAWARMLADAEAGRFELVVAVDVDRLLRSTRDMNTLIDLGVNVATVDGEIDLSTADGEMRAGFLALLARFETRRKSERQVRANAARRDRGLPVLSGKTPFGYTKDGEQVAEQAEAVRRAFDAFLAPEPLSIARIADDLNTRGFKTTRGTAWSTYAVRYMLSNPLYAGRIKHHSTGALYPVDTAQGFEPIVPLAVVEAATAKLERNRARRTDRGNRPRYLLSGIAKCGRCGAGMVSGQNERRVPNYRCIACRKLSRQREPVDAMVTEAVLTRLSAPDAVGLFAPAEPTVDLGALRDERARLTARLDELGALLVDPVVPVATTRAAIADVQRAIVDVDARYVVGGDGALGEFVGVLDADDDQARRAVVDAVWADLDMDRRRMVVDVLVTVTIRPAPQGVRTFDPSLIVIEPRG